MRLKVFFVFAAALLLAACESTSSDTSGQTSTGTGSGATTSSGPVAGTQEDLLVQVGDRVFFDFDRSDLRSDARSTIEGLAAWLNANPQVTLTVEGHADERGTREYNLALGERRANSVRDYLVALGIDANRLATISYGKERPAVLGSNEESWAQNRRGVFVVN